MSELRREKSPPPKQPTQKPVHQEEESFTQKSADERLQVPQFNPAITNPRTVLYLQRTVGNRATQDLLHRDKPTISINPWPAGNTAIQRMTSSADLKLGGVDKSPSGNPVVQSVEDYEKDKDKAPVLRRLELLGKIIESCNKWIKANRKGSQQIKAKINTLINEARKELLEKATPSLVQAEDVICQVFATKVVYGTQKGQWKDLLEKLGYDPKKAGHEEKMGFFVDLYLPNDKGKKENRRPILVFKGTSAGNPSGKLADYLTDVDPTAYPGFWPFYFNRSYIKKMIDDKAGGKVVVTGHSLGGALAQYAAIWFPEKIHRVVTFQSAAIHYSKSFRKLKNKPGVTHHRAETDVVPKGGLSHLPGEFFVHATGKKGFAAHGLSLLASSIFKPQMDSLGISLVELGNIGMTVLPTSKVKYHRQDPTWVLTRIVSDIGRRAAGVGLGPTMYVIDRGARGWVLAKPGLVETGRKVQEKVDEVRKECQRNLKLLGDWWKKNVNWKKLFKKK